MGERLEPIDARAPVGPEPSPVSAPEPVFPGPEWRDDHDAREMPRRRAARRIYAVVACLFIASFLWPLGITLWSRLGGIGSKADAEAAVSRLALARVGDATSSRAWLRVLDDGSFEAEGYFTGSNSTGDWFASGSTYGFTVEESVGGVKLAHALQLEVSPDTPAVLDGARTTYGKSGADEAGPRRAVVRFRVRGEHLVAEEVRFTGTLDWAGWPDDYPFDGVQSGDGFPERLGGAFWLDAGAGRPGVVHGQVGQTVEEDGGAVPAGSADLAVPDRLGRAPIEHVVRIFWRKWPGIGVTGGGGPQDIRVTVTDRRVWLAR